MHFLVCVPAIVATLGFNAMKINSDKIGFGCTISLKDGLVVFKLRWYARATWLSTGLRTTCPNHLNLLVLIVYVITVFIYKAVLVFDSVAQPNNGDGSQTSHFKCL